MPVPMSCDAARDRRPLPSRATTTSTLQVPPPGVGPLRRGAAEARASRDPGPSPASCAGSSPSRSARRRSSTRARARGCGSFMRRTSSGSIPIAWANSSTALSSANTPCGWPGARNARAAPVNVRDGDLRHGGGGDGVEDRVRAPPPRDRPRRPCRSLADEHGEAPVLRAAERQALDRVGPVAPARCSSRRVVHAAHRALRLLRELAPRRGRRPRSRTCSRSRRP